LIATLPILQRSAVSTIPMDSTTRPWSEEVGYVKQLLGGEVTLMSIFGVTPLPYVTGVTTRSLTQDLPTICDFSGDRPSPGHIRIIWKIASSGDSFVTERMKL
jgi:hypothetical protein